VAEEETAAAGERMGRALQQSLLLAGWSSEEREQLALLLEPLSIAKGSAQLHEELWTVGEAIELFRERGLMYVSELLVTWLGEAVPLVPTARSMRSGSVRCARTPRCCTTSASIATRTRSCSSTANSARGLAASPRDDGG